MYIITICNGLFFCFGLFFFFAQEWASIQDTQEFMGVITDMLKAVLHQPLRMVTEMLSHYVQWQLRPTNAL